ncbi:MAG: putative metal-binding motif-containing protein [Polyangiales bacterium]
MRWGLCMVVVAFGCGGGGGMGDDAGADADVCATCDDGLYCNGEESCVEGVCRPGTAPCAVCDEEADRCSECDADGDGARATGCGGDDCDDGNAAVRPGATEICDLEGVDEDCDPSTFGFRDADGDGVGDARCCNGDTCGTDCDDANGNVAPGRTEACNEVDDDCDGSTDEGATTTFYVDTDGDDFGSPDMTVEACAQPDGYSENDDDCDDTRRAANPGAVEVCDDVGDNDCDGLTVAAYDADRDGFDRYEEGGCPLGNDCDDTRADRYPGAPEVCDGERRDCSVAAGEDADGDGQVATDDVCVGGALAKTDCDDTDALAYLGASELCDGTDNDCDGNVDEAPFGEADLATTDVTCGDVACDFTCLGTWTRPAPSGFPLRTVRLNAVSLLGAVGGEVEIFDGDPTPNCPPETCEVKPVMSESFDANVRVDQVIAFRHRQPMGEVTVVQHVAGTSGVVAVGADDVFPLGAHAAILVRPTDCGGRQLDSESLAIRFFDAGTASCPSRTVREVLGTDVGLIVPSIPAPPEGRRTLVEVWARVAGTPTIVAREHLWVFQDQYSIATLPPLRADSPTP